MVAIGEDLDGILGVGSENRRPGVVTGTVAAEQGFEAVGALGSLELNWRAAGHGSF